MIHAIFVIKTFTKHRGRIGQRGGSLPKNETQMPKSRGEIEFEQRNEEMRRRIAAEREDGDANRAEAERKNLYASQRAAAQDATKNPKQLGLTRDEMMAVKKMANAWIGWNGMNFYKELLDHIMRGEDDVKPLVKAIEAAPSIPYELHRGITFDALPKEGDVITQQAASWTTDKNVARDFASGRYANHKKYGVVLTGKNIKALPITRWSTQTDKGLKAADEHLARGAYKITKYTYRDPISGVYYAEVEPVER